MLNILLDLWVICVAFGPAYNIVGDIGVFGIMLAILLFNRKIKIEKNLITSIILFTILITYKALGIHNNQAISQFHSAYGVVNTSVKLIFFAFFLQIIVPIVGDNKERMGKLFFAMFHISIAISIGVLMVVGRNTYRINASEGGVFLAPQIYIIISVFMIMALVYLIINNKEKRGIRLSLIALNFIYIFLSNYTTQLLFAIISIFLVITLGSKMKNRNKIIIVGLLGIIIILGIPMLPTIIELINRTFFATNETVNVRLNEIVLLLRRENIKGSDLMGRFDLINLSWSTFKLNPLLGIHFSNYNTVVSGLKVGGHSEWPDDLARFGIIGGVIFTFFVISILKKTLYFENNYSFKFSMVVMILLYGFFNPIIRYMEFEFFFLISLFIDNLVNINGGCNNLWNREKIQS